MSELQAFRTRLGKLKNRRALTRWQTALARGLVLAVIALLALFAMDFSFHLATVPRAAVISVVAGILVWKAFCYIPQSFSVHESIADMALLLERLHCVDSDLVAALQFDGSRRSADDNLPVGRNKALRSSGSGVTIGSRRNCEDLFRPTCLGSLELQQAVVERASKISETLDYQSAIPKHEARRATRLAVIAGVLVLVGCFAMPDHANAFWNRLWLGDATYPTRTVIEQVEINGQADEARVVGGEPIVFHVQCSGVAPAEGVASLRGIETGDSTSLILKRLDKSSHVATYTVDGPRLNEPVEYSLQIGDAETEPRSIALIRRPLVELTIEAVAPAYMRRETIRQQEHYVQVLEGSAIALSIRCANGKRLTEARFELSKDDKQAEQLEAIAFMPRGESGMEWHLDADASGLVRVVKGFQFRVVVVDEDGLGTYHPIEGAVRVKLDRTPEASLESLHYAVMPTARPTITYTAQDDFGVGSVVLHARRATTQDPDTDESEAVALGLPIPQAHGPTRQTIVRAEHALDLKPLNLVERDKLLVWIEVTDYRGKWPGVSTISEAIELDVMDERGVLDAILRSDADAEQMLTDVIEKELGLRGNNLLGAEAK